MQEASQLCLPEGQRWLGKTASATLGGIACWSSAIRRALAVLGSLISDIISGTVRSLCNPEHPSRVHLGQDPANHPGVVDAPEGAGLRCGGLGAGLLLRHLHLLTVHEPDRKVARK